MAYSKALKIEKTKIAEILIKTVHSWGGRFLKKDDEKLKWYVVHSTAARGKASRALREDPTECSEKRRERQKYGSWN